jgi:hypothetical protein
MDLSLLSTLKRKLHEAKRFADVWDYFLTYFGEDPEFIALSQRAGDPFLEGVLAVVGEQLFGRPVELTDMLLTRIPEHGFIHGAVQLGGKPASEIYFEEIHKGVLAVIWSFSPPETKYVRFTGRALYDSLNRSDN